MQLAAPLDFPQRGIVLQNRIAKAPMSEQLADRSGAPSDALLALYRTWSRSGAGLIITGNVMVDGGRFVEPRNVVLENLNHADRMKAWARACKGTEDVVAIMQLNHPGRCGLLPLLSRPVGPSEVAVGIPVMSWRRPIALTEEDIENLVGRFARSAEMAVFAGFDGVQIHAAHGYLLSQFLSPLANTRTDKYGASAEGRRLFLERVVAQTRLAIGTRKLLSVKLNSADFQRGGISEEDTVQVILSLEKLGVDFVEVSGGNYEQPAMLGMASPSSSSSPEREAYFLGFAELLKKHTSLPVMLSGGMRTPAFMNAVLERGVVDIIGLGRPFAVHAYAGRMLLAGRAVRVPRISSVLGIRVLDAYVNVAWPGLKLAEIANRELMYLPPQEEEGEDDQPPRVVSGIRALLKAVRIVSSKALTQYEANDNLWFVVLTVLCAVGVRGYLVYHGHIDGAVAWRV